MGWGDTGTAPDLANAGTTNAYDFGKAVATRYAGYPNIVWHVMGDFGWSYNQGPGLALDALFHGIKDTEGTSHRLIIAEPADRLHVARSIHLRRRRQGLPMVQTERQHGVPTTAAIPSSSLTKSTTEQVRHEISGCRY